LKLTSISGKSGSTFHMTPGTSVTGVMNITTFFSKAADAAPPATTPASAKR